MFKHCRTELSVRAPQLEVVLQLDYHNELLFCMATY